MEIQIYQYFQNISSRYFTDSNDPSKLNPNIFDIPAYFMDIKNGNLMQETARRTTYTDYVRTVNNQTVTFQIDRILAYLRYSSILGNTAGTGKWLNAIILHQ